MIPNLSLASVIIEEQLACSYQNDFFFPSDFCDAQITRSCMKLKYEIVTEHPILTKVEQMRGPTTMSDPETILPPGALGATASAHRPRVAIVCCAPLFRAVMP